VRIDCCSDYLSIQQSVGVGWAVVVIDVIRATTTAVTAVSHGRQCFPVSSETAAYKIARSLRDPLLMGERAGLKPEGFDLNNSPAALAERDDVSRPVVLMSSSGTRLLVSLREHHPTYVACFRNFSAVANYLIVHQRMNVALLAAATRGEFREEDQMCCAWIGAKLLAFDYKATDLRTSQVIDRWHNSHPSECLQGPSAAFLKSTNQMDDLSFVLEHIDDVNCVYLQSDGQIHQQPIAQIQTAISA